MTHPVFQDQIQLATHNEMPTENQFFKSLIFLRLMAGSNQQNYACGGDFPMPSPHNNGFNNSTQT